MLRAEEQVTSCPFPLTTLHAAAKEIVHMKKRRTSHLVPLIVNGRVYEITLFSDDNFAGYEE